MHDSIFLKAGSNMKQKVRKKQVKKSLLALALAILFLAGLGTGTYYYKSEQSIETLSKMGSRGEEVRKVQQKLKNLGYYTGSVDGIYGTLTQTAVRKFQRDNGLSVDGIAGPKTLSYLGISSGTSGSGQYSSNDVYLLAKVIAAEARGEPYSGQVAVGAVILNRVNHSSFPDSIAGVVYQPGAFSCINDSNWGVEPSAESKKAARDAINGWDPSGGAIYYYNPAKTSNRWMRTRPVIVTIGSHLFCK